MSKKLRKAVFDYIKLLKRLYADRIVTAVLFGSAARNEADKESDADILIVVSEGSQAIKDEISMSAYDIMLANDVVLSPLVMDQDTFAWYKRYKDPLYKNIRKDGIELWTKTPESLLKSA